MNDIFQKELPSDNSIKMRLNGIIIDSKLIDSYRDGKLLFICGAGISQSTPSNLPNFENLVVKLYELEDKDVYNLIKNKNKIFHYSWKKSYSLLTDTQKEEVSLFLKKDFDLALGLLKIRKPILNYRERIKNIFDEINPKRNQYHRSLMKLSERTNIQFERDILIATTNFDLLLENATPKQLKHKVKTYSLSEIPRPTRKKPYSGVMHLHGSLSKDGKQNSDLVLTDKDFGSYYFSRQIVPQFMFDVVRNYTVVFIGYSASDPPMRYLLSALSADDEVFDDHYNRFAFVPEDEDFRRNLHQWKLRNVDVFSYDPQNSHQTLLEFIKKWIMLFGGEVKQKNTENEILKLIKNKYKIDKYDLSLVIYIISKYQLEISFLNKISKYDIITFFNLECILRNIPSENTQITRNLIQNFLFKNYKNKFCFDWIFQIQTNLQENKQTQFDKIANEEINNLKNIIDLDRKEIWSKAWRIYFDYIHDKKIHTGTLREVFDLSKRYKEGDRTIGLVDDIVAMVRPRFEISEIGEWERQFRIIPKIPRTLNDLFNVRMTSDDLVNLRDFKIIEDNDLGFLERLAEALDAALNESFNMADMIAPKWREKPWRISRLHRVYYWKEPTTTGDTDQFNRGMAPIIKLLHAVVKRISKIDTQAAKKRVDIWRMRENPFHQRLWAALARDPELVPDKEVADYLRKCKAKLFWDNNEYFEIAELRGGRFAKLESRDQTAILKRITRLEPIESWMKKLSGEEIEKRRYWRCLDELERLIAGGSSLSKTALDLVAELRGRYPDHERISSVDGGASRTGVSGWMEAEPEREFDDLSGKPRIVRLNEALQAPLDIFNPTRSDRAMAWLRFGDNARKLLGDFEGLTSDDVEYPRVWEAFFRTLKVSDEESQRLTNRDDTKRVAGLLWGLTEETSKQVCVPICNWMEQWKKYVADDEVIPSDQLLFLWARFWPFACEKTNKEGQEKGDNNLNTVAQSRDDDEPMNLDVYNGPVPSLISVFLEGCPKNVTPGDTRMSSNDMLKKMRSDIVSATGKTGVIGRYRLIESLYYFYSADPKWAKEKLIPPLLKADKEEKENLWRAAARGALRSSLLKEIGEEVCKQVLNNNLGTNTRRNLAFYLVIEGLIALEKKRQPAIPFQSITQIIRMAEKSVRNQCGFAIWRYIEAEEAEEKESSYRAIKKFMQEYWPLERFLLTETISEYFAHIPAYSGKYFADAVEMIAPFILPFDCYSLGDLGFTVSLDDHPKFKETVNTPKNAEAFLKLLDLAIRKDGRVILPYNLNEVLDHLKTIEPKLSRRGEFVRLQREIRNRM
jgi:hypothetical protein